MARKKKRRLKKKFYLFVIIVLALFIGVLFFLNKDRFLETVDDIVDKLPSEEVKKLEIVVEPLYKKVEKWWLKLLKRKLPNFSRRK